MTSIKFTGELDVELTNPFKHTDLIYAVYIEQEDGSWYATPVRIFVTPKKIKMLFGSDSVGVQMKIVLAG